MSQELLIAVLAGLGGMLGWGLADFFAKKTMGTLSDVMTLAWAGAFGTVAFLAAAVYQIYFGTGSISFPTDAFTWVLLIFFGALQAAVYLFAYRGFGKGQISLLVPVFASFTGIVALVSVAFFGETLTMWSGIALAVIFSGLMLISVDLNAMRGRIDFMRVPGLNEVLIATLLAALWTITWDQFVSGQDWLAYALYMFTFMTVAVFLYAKMQGIAFGVSPSSTWFFLAAIGVSEVLAYIAISYGYGATSLTSIVTMISGAFALPTIILAHVFLGERLSRIQNVGIMLILTGIVALSFH